MPIAQHQIALFSIRSDAVLIHPGMAGIPIINPPRIVAAPNSPHADFFVATAVPPIDWLGMLRWYGISQPRRKHIWAVRALLHLYLMLSTRDFITAELDAQETFFYLTNNLDVSYQDALDQGTHPIIGFWPRIPEMLILALSVAKEDYVPRVLSALLSVCTKTKGDEVTKNEFCDMMEKAMGLMAAHINKGTFTQLGITRRRAGVIERSLRNGVTRAGSLSGMIPFAANSKLMSEHKKMALKSVRSHTGLLTRMFSPVLDEPKPSMATTLATPPAEPAHGPILTHSVDLLGHPATPMGTPDLFALPDPARKPKANRNRGVPEEKVRQLYAEAEARLVEMGVLPELQPDLTEK